MATTSDHADGCQNDEAGYMGTILEIGGAVECSIIARRNRFVVEVEVDGRRRLASINNTGRLLEFLVPARRCFCTPQPGQLKTEFRLFAVEDRNAGALIDTQLQMRAFEQSLSMGLVPWLSGRTMVKRNARIGSSLIDYMLSLGGETSYLEVKSAALRDGHYAMYPDCPSARGRKHIRELTACVRDGGTAFILFIAALPEVVAFKPDRAADPELCDLLVAAREVGVVFKSLNIIFRPETSTVSLHDPDLPVELA